MERTSAMSITSMSRSLLIEANNTSLEPSPIAIGRKRQHNAKQFANAVSERVGRYLLIPQFVEITGDPLLRNAILQGHTKVGTGVRQECQPAAIATPILVACGRLPGGGRAAFE